MATATAASLGYGNSAVIRQGKDVLGGCRWNTCGGEFKMVDSGKRKKKTGAMIAVMAEASSVGALSDSNHRKLVIPTFGNQELPPVSPKKLEEWTRQSISEIMRNIKQAPFLVQVYSNDGSCVDDAAPSSTSSLRLETQPVPSRNWDSIRKKWDEDGCPSPDGIILVEELNENEGEGEDYHGKKEGESGLIGNYSHSNNSSNKTWGLLVQGRGAERSVCYILNTCRVLSSVGASTHFCLVRAKCFGDTADVQLRKAWLQ